MDKELKGTIKILKVLEKEIVAKFKAYIIGIIGSYARGEQRYESDVDILVRFHEGATLLDYVGLADFLEEKLNKKVDIVSDRTIREELREQILSEVIKV